MTNEQLHKEAERLLRKLRNSPKLWEADSAKIDRVLLKAKARMMRRAMLPGVPRHSPRDWMLDTYA